MLPAGSPAGYPIKNWVNLTNLNQTQKLWFVGTCVSHPWYPMSYLHDIIILVLKPPTACYWKVGAMTAIGRPGFQPQNMAKTLMACVMLCGSKAAKRAAKESSANFQKKGNPTTPTNRSLPLIQNGWLLKSDDLYGWFSFPSWMLVFLRQHALENMDLHMPCPVLERNKQIE